MNRRTTVVLFFLVFYYCNRVSTEIIGRKFQCYHLIKLYSLFSACSDVATNCPQHANLCNNSVYYTLLTQQCPSTCNRCPNTCKLLSPLSNLIITILGFDIADNCAENARLCYDSVYRSLMAQKCPRTCGTCPASR